MFIRIYIEFGSKCVICCREAIGSKCVLCNSEADWIVNLCYVTSKLIGPFSKCVLCYSEANWVCVCYVTAKPIDLLAQYISAEDDELAIEMHEPYTYLNVREQPQ